MSNPTASGEHASADTATQQLMHLAAAGACVPAALRAAAQEVRGRGAREELERLAVAIDRGEFASMAHADLRQRFYAAVTISKTTIVSALSDYLRVHEMLAFMRHRVVQCVVIAAMLMLLASVVGAFVLLFPDAEIRRLIESFNVELLPGLEVLRVLNVVVLVFSALFAWLVVLLLMMRRSDRLGSVADMLLDGVPMVGSSLAAIDLAEMTDGVARTLAAGRNYGDAFRETAAVVTSARMRAWLAAAAQTIDRGAALASVLPRLPIRSSLLPALVGQSGPHPDAPVIAWQTAAESLLRAAIRQSRRLFFLLPPIAATLAAMLAWSSLLITMARFQTLQSMLTSLGGF